MLLLVGPYSDVQRQVLRESLEQRSRKALDLTRSPSTFVIAEFRCADRNTIALVCVSPQATPAQSLQRTGREECGAPRGVRGLPAREDTHHQERRRVRVADADGAACSERQECVSWSDSLSTQAIGAEGATVTAVSPSFKAQASRLWSGGRIGRVRADLPAHKRRVKHDRA
jgi:hypothetical protein